MRCSRSSALLRAGLAMLAACGGGEALDPVAIERPLLPALPAADPGALGPYAIGVTTVEVPDDGPLGRVLPVEVWYPAEVAAGAATAIYALTIGPLTLVELPSPAGAARDALTDLRGAPHPLVVFSHGFGGVRVQSVYLTEYLASHGFVVAAPDHVGNTFRELVQQSTQLPAATMARLRPEDVTRTIDAMLARSADPADPLYRLADPARVGVAGHSFGGYTAVRIAGAAIDLERIAAECAADPDNVFCDGWVEGALPESARDDRVIAALPQAPAGDLIYGDHGMDEVRIPVMYQGGTADETTPFVEEQQVPYGKLARDAYLLGIERAGHFTFSDMCGLVDAIGLGVEQFDDGCGGDNVDPTRAHALVDRYATAFFQEHLSGEGDALGVLDASRPRPQGVATFERH
jgi:predicted dienelactone hydrolase